MSEQNTQREAAVQQQQAVAQSRNLNAELQILAKFGGFNEMCIRDRHRHDGRGRGNGRMHVYPDGQVAELGDRHTRHGRKDFAQTRLNLVQSRLGG